MHLDALLFISDQLFGKGYYTKNQLSELDQSSIVRVAIVKEKVIGFFVFKILTSKSALYLNSNAETKILEVKTIAVSPSYQRMGVGSRMFSAVNNFLEEHNIENCYCVAWRRGDFVPMHNIHIRNSFEVLKEIDNYWYEDSIKNQFHCPDCGIPCYCSAVIYKKQC